MAVTARTRTAAIGRSIAYVLGGLLALTTYGLAIWQAPEFLTNQDVLRKAEPEQRLPAEHNARLIVVSIGGALVVGTGLLYTARNYRLAHRGQVTERFTKALERLSSDEMYVRIGGIHALEHVMRDSLDHHGDVVEVLVAFTRDQVDRRTDQLAGETLWMHPPIGAEPPAMPEELAPDVQAAVTALGKRPDRAKHERDLINFEQLHLMGAVFRRAHFKKAMFTEAQLKGANLVEAQFQGANLAGAQLQRANLTGAQLQGANLTGAQLQRAFLIGAQLQAAFLSGAQLQNATLWKAELNNARLRKTELQDANLMNAQLRGATLWSADLKGANLTKAQLRDADLTGAQLQGAYLTEAQLQNADLTRAQLQNADLTRAQLQGANLTGAQLQGANLTGAQLQGANLTDAIVIAEQLQSAGESWEKNFPQPPPTIDVNQKHPRP